MSDYTILNLLELEDTVSERVPGMEGRFARSQMGSRDIGVSHFRYVPGKRGGPHHHREQEEAYLVVSGSGRMMLGDELRDIRRWDLIRVSPELVRAFEAGPDGLEIVAVGGPKPEGGDGVRAEEPWPEE